jgi:hypothetical protein
VDYISVSREMEMPLRALLYSLFWRHGYLET